MRVPLINARELKSISPLLPPTGGPGKPRSDDRLYVSAFYYCEATRCSLESLPAGYCNARSLRTRRQRWTADGTLPKLLEAGVPIVERMRDAYWGQVCAASDVDSPNWRTSSEFFGKGVIPRAPHLQPKGRYAADRRR
jgi:transposase